jgi:hypothetical protein
MTTIFGTHGGAEQLTEAEQYVDTVMGVPLLLVTQ